MKNNSDLHILNKNLGESPLDCILRFRKINPEFEKVPMTYAGRLDPMAEGALIVLSGESVHEKERYLDLPKTYVFEILWGFGTDTFDVLGMVTGENSEEPQEAVVSQSLRTGRFEQRYPAYSSKPVQGKPLFQWAREGRLAEVEIPKHAVEIFNARFVSRRKIGKMNLLQDIISKIKTVTGDFRQEEIARSWNDAIGRSSEEKFAIDTIEMTVSSGFYVRQFVSDFSAEFQAKALCFHIKRTKIGEFSI